MTLPSQFARPSGRNYMFRRRRTGRKVFLGVLVVLLILVIGVWRWVGTDGDTTRFALAGGHEAVIPGENSFVEAANPPLAREEQPRTSQQPRAHQQPVEPEIRMGESLPSNVSSPVHASVPEAPRETVPQSQPQAEPTRSTETARVPTQPSSQPASTPARSAAQQRAHDRIRIGNELLATNRPIEARVALTQALDSGVLEPATARRLRQTLTELNERLVFSPEIVVGDPFSFGYTIRSGDALARLPRAQGLATDWRFIQRVNRIQRPQAIRAGQNIKLVTGPFHAVVYKRQFRMDVYMGDGAERVYVRSFPVGLGEYDSTPVGTFKVRPNSKLINPEWVNPRTGERFLPDDPMNPIGEHWIGLVGVSDGVRDLGGYGIHGTIEPDSIGRQASMGCIRMGADDVAVIYELLVEDHSTIEIVDR